MGTLVNSWDIISSTVIGRILLISQQYNYNRIRNQCSFFLQKQKVCFQPLKTVVTYPGSLAYHKVVIGNTNIQAYFEDIFNATGRDLQS